MKSLRSDRVTFNIMVTGPSGCGKSSFLNTLLTTYADNTSSSSNGIRSTCGGVLPIQPSSSFDDCLESGTIKISKIGSFRAFDDKKNEMVSYGCNRTCSLFDVNQSKSQ